MRLTASQFDAWSNKAITLLGMSGVGKTTLANKLPKTNWFHYSGDYRIGTKYLEEPILDTKSGGELAIWPRSRMGICTRQNTTESDLLGSFG